MPYFRTDLGRAYGQWPMGRPRVPPLPQAIIMEDESAYGTFYFLSHTGNPGSMTLVLSPTLYTKPDRVIFPHDDGPYLPGGQKGSVKLYIRRGTLNGRFYDPPFIQSPRVLTRNGWQRRLLELSVGPTWEPGDSFTLTEVQL